MTLFLDLISLAHSFHKSLTYVVHFEFKALQQRTTTMKTKYSVNNASTGNSRRIVKRRSNATARVIVPPIPFRRVEEETLSKDRYASFKLRSDPSASDSPTYELAVRYYSTGTPEQWLLYLKAVDQVLTGQNVTTGPHKYAMHRRLLKGDALARFNSAATATGNETNANLVEVLKLVTTHVFPDRALVKQRLYMNRHMRKPRNTPIRQYVARWREINDYLKSFPPFEANQEWSEDDLKEQLYANLPAIFINPMRNQHDIFAKSVDSTIDWCEGIEEEQENEQLLAAATKTESSVPRKRKASDNDSPRERLTFIPCRIHGRAHDNRDCKVQQDFLDKAITEHQRKKRKFENDKLSEKAKKIGFKSESQMKSFFMAAIEAYSKKQESSNSSGNKQTNRELYTINEEANEDDSTTEVEMNNDDADATLDVDGIDPEFDMDLEISDTKEGEVLDIENDDN